MKYAVVYEPSENGFGAYAPDLPGCAVVGDDMNEVVKLMREAITFHIEGLRAEGIPIPEPSARCEYITLD